MSYFEERLKSLGATKKDCTAILNSEGSKDEDRTGNFQFIQECEKGIKIFFFDINGNVRYYDWFDPTQSNYSRMQKSSHTEYCIIRLEEPKGDMKYEFPKGVGETFPWIPPQIVEKFKK